jgi:biopolymer transport protein ExbB/TolQ
MPDLWLISSVGGGCQATVGDLWRSMGWLMRADVTLLATMLAYLVGITCKRFYRFAATRRHSRLFVRNVASALQRENLTEAIVVATHHSRGHVASIVAAGLKAFVDAAPQLTDAEAIGAAERAFQRRHRRLVADLKSGVGTLTSIALLAPFIGLVGTVFGIMGAFVGGGDRSTGLSYVAGGLAEALVTTAFGLLVAIPSVWCRNYVLTSVEIFESEMSNATLETMTYCDSHCHLRHVPEHPGAGKTRYGSVLDDISGTRSWEIAYDRPRGLLLLVSFYTLLFVLLVVSTALVASLGAR